MYGLLIGVIAGVVCFFGATSLKHVFGYDDSLDAFGVHGVGGTIGASSPGSSRSPSADQPPPAAVRSKATGSRSSINSPPSP